MANFVVQQSIGYVDAKGNQARVNGFFSADTYANAATLLGNWSAAMDALTNAAEISAPGIGGYVTRSGQYGAAALEYPSVTDKAVMTFIDSAGGIHRFTVPAPKSTIFLADLITVNRANAAVATYVNFVVNGGSAAYFFSTKSGLQFSSFVGGMRVKKANRLRISIFTKDASLAGVAE